MRRPGIFWVLTCALLFGYSARGVRAGGFDQFDQGVDLLFDPGRLTIDTALIATFPDRKLGSVNGVPETVPFGVNTYRPSINIKAQLFDDIACLASYRQPFGAHSDYGSTWSQTRSAVSRSLQVDQFGLACSYRIRAGEGFVRLIAGGARNSASYKEEALRVLPNTTTIQPRIDLEGGAYGWRAGLAYELPGSGIRVSVIYNAAVDLTVRGAFSELPLGGNASLPAVPAFASASIPRTVEASAQFPLANNLLNTMAVKWADWSVWTRVPVVLAANAGPLSAGRELSVYNAFFRDGWTISNTVSYRWSEKLGLSFRVAWDRGVATGWTEHTDSWSANVGASYRIYDNVELIAALTGAYLNSWRDRQARAGRKLQRHRRGRLGHLGAGRDAGPLRAADVGWVEGSDTHCLGVPLGMGLVVPADKIVELVANDEMLKAGRAQ